jgi:hypothetical protein
MQKNRKIEINFSCRGFWDKDKSISESLMFFVRNFGITTQ